MDIVKKKRSCGEKFYYSWLKEIRDIHNKTIITFLEKELKSWKQTILGIYRENKALKDKVKKYKSQ